MSPEQHADRRRRLTAAAALDAARRWAQVDPDDIARSWSAQLPAAVTVLTGAQVAAAGDAEDYLDEFAPPADVEVDPTGFGGVASDGGSLATLLYQPAISALMAIGAGAPTRRALAGGLASLDTIVRTQVADAGRGADQAGLTARKQVTGYVRQVVGATCSRCIILAGRFYRWNQGFQRHPRCDCIHVPATREQWRQAGRFHDPQQLYDSLSVAERRRAGWSLADQEAIADGADLTFVTNMKGVTTAGTRRSAGRLTTDQIYKRAGGDRDEAIRLLRQNGYLRGAPVRTPVARPVSTPVVTPVTRPAAQFRPSSSAPSLADLVAPLRPGKKVPPALFGDWIDGTYAGLNAKVTKVTVAHDGVRISGSIYAPDVTKTIGTFSRVVARDEAGDLFVVHELLKIARNHQGSGFQAAFNGNLLDWYRRSGVKYVKVGANIDIGGYTWARAGYDFADDFSALGLFGQLNNRLREIRGLPLRQLDWLDDAHNVPAYTWTGPVVFEAKPAWAKEKLRKAFKGASDDEIERQLRVADDFLRSLAGKRFGADDFPSAYELSQLGRWEGAGKNDIWIGKLVMLGSSWLGILRL